ncbi:hypothetical protein LZ32DRAFT_622411 [Colletotrichum eremochloae]|nr:hypothetical protein LZ32DRAFT_622411 [Colletotrichum eremochloae]
MRYSLVFFLVPAIAAPQRPTKPVPVTPQTGGLCCSNTGIADPSGTCSGTKADGTNTTLNSYCCSAFPDWSAHRQSQSALPKTAGRHHGPWRAAIDFIKELADSRPKMELDTSGIAYAGASFGGYFALTRRRRPAHQSLCVP